MNLIAEWLIQDLEIPVQELDKPLKIGSVNDPGAMIVTTTAHVKHTIGKTVYRDTFYVAPLANKTELILGTPWIQKHYPETLRTLENIGEAHTNDRFYGGGNNCNSHACRDCRNFRANLVELEIERQEGSREEDALCTAARSLRIYCEEKEEARPAVKRAAQEGEAGVRGLTGHKEGWQATIPAPFRKYIGTVFSEEGLKRKPPQRPGFECTLELKEGESLSRSQPYEMAEYRRKNLKALCQLEEEAGIIVRSRAPAAAPGFWVKDPGSQQERWVVDYREVNLKTKKDAYPLPRVNTLIERAARAKVVSVLDVSRAFANIPMSPGSRELTAFTTPFGMFEYNYMPMGLANAPSVWQRFIDSILGPISHDFCYAYLDDILVVSETQEEHEEHCKRVLDVLQEHQLYVKPHKCHWFQPEVEFLGFRIIAGKGVTMAADKLQAIRNMEEPRTVKDLRTLLGVFGYNESFARHYSDYTAVMTDLLKKDEPWDWNETRRAAFLGLKERFMEQVVRNGFRPDRPTRLCTDSSDVARGLVIEQLLEEGGWGPILLSSHKFKDAEKGWDGPDKELYAIVAAFRDHQKWLAQPAHTVKVYTDHRNLAKFMFTSNLLKSHDGRLGRWWLELSQCDLEIQYTPGNVPGSEVAMADWLSRYNLPDSVDLPPKQLLAAYRFSPKALADIDGWFRKEKDYEGIRKRLERSFAQSTEDNSRMISVLKQGDKLEAEKLNDSPDPVPAPAEGSASMAAPQRAHFGNRYSERNPEARVPVVPARNSRSPKEKEGLGFKLRPAQARIAALCSQVAKWYGMEGYEENR